MQRRKSFLAEMKKLPTIHATLKKKSLSPTALEQILNSPPLKHGVLYLWENGKWKERLAKLTETALVINYNLPEVSIQHLHSTSLPLRMNLCLSVNSLYCIPHFEFVDNY
jgi:hypothetical protein